MFKHIYVENIFNMNNIKNMININKKIFLTY